MKKQHTKTVSLGKGLSEFVDMNIPNFSRFIRDNFGSMCLDYCDRKITHHRARIAYWNAKRRYILQQVVSILQTTNPKEIEFLKETVIIIGKNPQALPGRLAAFNSLFKHELLLDQFRMVLENLHLTNPEELIGGKDEMDD